jgi:hypothetical protein
MWDFVLTRIGCDIGVLVSLALVPVHNNTVHCMRMMGNVMILFLFKSLNGGIEQVR